MADSRRNEWRRCEGNKVVNHVNSIGMCESIGGEHARYSQQEDALIGFTLVGFNLLDSTTQEQILKSTIQTLEQKYGKKEQGSTVNGTIAWRQGQTVQTCTTNLGDSASYLVIISTDKDGNKKARMAQPLSVPHTAEKATEEELARIEAAGGAIFSNRLVGRLAVTRSLGDNEFNTKHELVSHQPDIQFNAKLLQENETAYIVVACDGLTEEKKERTKRDKEENRKGEEENKGKIDTKVTEEMIGRIISNASDPGNAAQQLVSAAEAFSTDNISVAVFPVEDTIPHGAFVFDGHGGNYVSYHAGDNFYKTAEQELKQKLQSIITPTFAKEKANSIQASAAFDQLYDFVRKHKNFLDKLKYSTLSETAQAILKIIKHLDASNYLVSLVELNKNLSVLQEKDKTKLLLPACQEIMESMQTLPVASNQAAPRKYS